MADNVDAYMPPYREVDHQTLWSQLEKPAGDPEQVAGLGAAWADPIRATLDDFVLDLDRDLKDLMQNYWSEASAGGGEFKRRMELVVRYADELSAHVGTITENLTAWETALRTAQGNAPDPEDTDDNGRALAGAAIGTAVAGPVGGVIGGLVGHSQDEEQKKEAHEKIVLIIATLAKDYDTAQQIKPPPPLPPVDLPDATDNGGPALTSINGAPVPTAEPFTPKPAGTPGAHNVNDPGSPGVPGSGDPALTDPDGTGLLGAGPGTITGVGVGTTGSLGLAGTGSGGALLGGGAGGAGAGLFPGAAAAGAHGLNNGSSLAGAKGGGGTPPPAKTGNAPKTPPPPGRGRGDAHPGRGREDEDATYMTWLTEDEMVWSEESDTPPTLLSTRRVDDEAPVADGRGAAGEDDTDAEA